MQEPSKLSGYLHMQRITFLTNTAIISHAPISKALCYSRSLHPIMAGQQRDYRGREYAMDAYRHRPADGHRRSRSPEARGLQRIFEDLEATLLRSHVPRERFEAVQHALLRQEDLTHARDDKIRELDGQIAGLEKKVKICKLETGQERTRFDRKALEVDAVEKKLAKAIKERHEMEKDLQERKQRFQSANEDDAILYRLGAKVLADMKQRVAQLENENKKLNAAIGSRDSTVAALNDEILRVSRASGDAMATMALDAQARRALVLIHSLQDDVDDGKKVIEELRIKNTQLLAASESLRAENERLKKLTHQDKRVAESKRAVKGKKRGKGLIVVKTKRQA